MSRFLELKHVIENIQDIKDKLIYSEELLCKYYVYRDREHAGQVLVELLQKSGVVNELKSRGIVLAIPCGGVAVTYSVVKALHIDFDLIVCRKIQIPWNPEAGYGAINPDGDVIIDEKFVEYLGLTKEDIDEGVRKTLSEIKRRNEVFRKLRRLWWFASRNQKTWNKKRRYAAGMVMTVPQLISEARYMRKHWASAM